MPDTADDSPVLQRGSPVSLSTHIPVGVLGVCTALLNAALVGATFPSLTVLSAPDQSTTVALVAGVLIAAAARFPLTVTITQSVACLVVASVPSLSTAALVAGVRFGPRSPIALIGAGVAAAIFASAPWLPTGMRLGASLAVLVPFAFGGLLHSMARQRRSRDERLILSLQNAALIEERSALREREPIADELHDRLGHRLTAIEIQARLVLERRVATEAFSRKASMIRDQADKALEDIRSIILAPRTTGFHEPSASGRGQSLEEQARDIADAVNVETICSFDDSISTLPFDLSYIVLRVLQEGMTNAARHAPKQVVGLSARRVRYGFLITLENHTLTRPVSPPGRGLASLERRLAQVGGTLTTRCTDGRRFILEAFVPYPVSGRP